MEKCITDLNNLERLLNDYDGLRLHGEWLKKHSLSKELKYVVYNVSHYGVYLHADIYKPVLDSYEIEVIPKHEIGLVIEK
jgi:hypothetical protein